MNLDFVRQKAFDLFKKWGLSLLLFPFIIYSMHQAWWTLHFNIFFAISYDFPFPINIINIFITNFLLIIHEAGHTFFSILGWRTLTILGGSLLQIILPFIILFYFWLKRIKSGIQCWFYIVGFSFINVAFYIADAGARQLPLIGGLPKEAHDWYNLLSRWHALNYDDTIAVYVAATGVLCYLTALILPAFFKTYKHADLDLDL